MIGSYRRERAVFVTEILARARRSRNVRRRAFAPDLVVGRASAPKSRRLRVVRQAPPA
jgi:hypothetical protein